MKRKSIFCTFFFCYLCFDIIATLARFCIFIHFHWNCEKGNEQPKSDASLLMCFPFALRPCTLKDGSQILLSIFYLKARTWNFYTRNLNLITLIIFFPMLFGRFRKTMKSRRKYSTKAFCQALIILIGFTCVVKFVLLWMTISLPQKIAGFCAREKVWFSSWSSARILNWRKSEKSYA